MEWLNAKFKLIETIQPKMPLPLDVVKCNYCKKKNTIMLQCGSKCRPEL